MKLIPAHRKYAAAYRDALQDGLHGINPSSLFQRIMRQFLYVTEFPFWLMDGERVIGVVTLRPALNARLMQTGGHIDYAIRSSERRRGYGTQILKMALPLLKKHGVTRALVTCRDDNAASIKIIEAAGGVLENKINIDLDGTTAIERRYWIDV